MALTSNWDLKDSNNKTVQTEKSRADVSDGQIYYVADLGATFGSTGSFWRLFRFYDDPPAGSKGRPEAYSKQRFIQGVRNGEVVFNYKGKNRAALMGIKVENARWMGDLLGRLSDKQISDAFRASGFNDSEVATYVRAVRGRIRQLQELGQRSTVISHRQCPVASAQWPSILYTGLQRPIRTAHYSIPIPETQNPTPKTQYPKPNTQNRLGNKH